MTNEEAIFCEKSYIGETYCTNCKYYGTETCKARESHRLAIKALEQEFVLENHKVGKWIKLGPWSVGLGMGEQYGHYYKCPYCDRQVKDYDGKKYFTHNYCPGCGARLEVEDDNE